MSKAMKNKTSIDWYGLTDAANAIRTLLNRKPRSRRLGYRVCPGGILNAYREGDLSFSRAVRAIERLIKEARGVRKSGR
jgi:hypothetical protein